MPFSGANLTHAQVVDQNEDLNKTINLSVAIASEYANLVPKGAKPVNVTSVSRDGQTYTLVKYRDFNIGLVDMIALDQNGTVVSYDAIPPRKIKIVGRKLSSQLNDPSSSINKNPAYKADVSIALPYDFFVPPPRIFDLVSTSDADRTQYFLGNKEIQEDDVDELNKSRSTELEINEERHIADLQSLKNEFLQLNAIDQSRVFNEKRNSNTDLVHLRLTGDEIRKLISNRLFEIDRIELFSAPSDTINQAMQWSEIWSHARFGAHQGQGIGIWQTEPACAANNAVANYTSTGTSAGHPLRMATVIRNVTPLAPIQCVTGSVLPTLAQANAATPQITVVSHSAAVQQATNNSTDYLIYDRNWDNNIYATGITIATAASNQGTIANFAVGSPARAVNAITIGNIDIDSNPDVIFYRSSWRNSTLGNEKPELSAPGAGTTLPGLPTTGGTSAATAHTAGFIANLMDSNATLVRNAQRTKAVMLSGATKSVVGGETKVGLGGIDYRDTSQHYSSFDYSGGNNIFGTLDALDGSTDGWITETVWLNSSKPNVRAVIAWLSRGTFVANNNMLSADYDLEVYAPNGSYVGGSYSILNPYEYVNFTVNSSGNYKFRIRRIANNDPVANQNLALAINFDN